MIFGFREILIIGSRKISLEKKTGFLIKSKFCFLSQNLAKFRKIKNLKFCENLARRRGEGSQFNPRPHIKNGISDEK
jgi:hypothetical protein